MRPDSSWCPSPNFTAGAKQRGVTCVVVHATATSRLDSAKEWLTDPKSEVSAHYLIDRDGTIYHLVHESNVAWHAGESSWKGMETVANKKTGTKSVNACSVGVELVNANDGVMDYPKAQVGACAALVAEICRDYDVAPEDVIGHLDIAPGRKTDPAHFPWLDLRGRITCLITS